MGWDGGTLLDTGSGKAPLEVMFEQKLESTEAARLCEESKGKMSGRRNSMCKDPVAGNTNEASLAESGGGGWSFA